MNENGTAPTLQAPVTLGMPLDLASEIADAWTAQDYTQGDFRGVVQRTPQMAVAQTIKAYVERITEGAA